MIRTQPYEFVHDVEKNAVETDPNLGVGDSSDWLPGWIRESCIKYAAGGDWTLNVREVADLNQLLIAVRMRTHRLCGERDAASRAADAATLKKRDPLYLVGGQIGSTCVDVFARREEAEGRILRYIFEDENDHWIGKLSKNQRTILETLRAAKQTAEIIIDYYNSVAHEDHKWFITTTELS